VNPLLQLQADVFGLLMSADVLANVNIVSWRKLRVDSQVEWDSLWQTPRNGRSGAGILVWMPTLRTEHANLPAGERVRLSISVVEEPNLNATPDTGTLISAEDLALAVKDLLHNQLIWGLAELVSQPDAITEDQDFENLLAYRVNFELVLARSKTARCDTPTIGEAGDTITLTNGANTPAAEIYYTTDGTLPVNAAALDPVTGQSINPASQLYTAPIPLAVGQSLTLRWVAYQLGFNPSNVQQTTITNNE
jgi:hypothetical protein